MTTASYIDMPETPPSVARLHRARATSGTSTGHLSKAAGSPASTHHHATEELLRRAVVAHESFLRNPRRGARARGGTAAERLEYVVRRMVEVLMAELPYVTLLLARGTGTAAVGAGAAAPVRPPGRRPAETEYPESYKGITLCPVCEWQEAQRTACSG
ncbi:hypothetical protein STENM223S_05949 [Streptomyces tendae]